MFCYSLAISKSSIDCELWTSVYTVYVVKLKTSWEERNHFIPASTRVKCKFQCGEVDKMHFKGLFIIPNKLRINNAMFR